MTRNPHESLSDSSSSRAMRVWRMSPLVMLGVFSAMFLWWVWSQSRSPVVSRIKGVHGDRQRFNTMGGARVDLTVVAARRGKGTPELIEGARREMERVWELYDPSREGGALGLLSDATSTVTLSLSERQATLLAHLARAVEFGLRMESGVTSVSEALSLPPLRLTVDIEARQLRVLGHGLGMRVLDLVRAQGMDAAALWLVENGARGALLNVNGDVRAFGTRVDATPWRIGIADPARPDRRVGDTVFQLQSNVAVSRGDGPTPDTREEEAAIRRAVVFAPSALLAKSVAQGLRNMTPSSARDAAAALGWAEAVLVDSKGDVSATPGLSRMFPERP